MDDRDRAAVAIGAVEKARTLQFAQVLSNLLRGHFGGGVLNDQIGQRRVAGAVEELRARQLGAVPQTLNQPDIPLVAEPRVVLCARVENDQDRALCVWQRLPLGRRRLVVGLVRLQQRQHAQVVVDPAVHEMPVLQEDRRIIPHRHLVQHDRHRRTRGHRVPDRILRQITVHGIERLVGEHEPLPRLQVRRVDQQPRPLGPKIGERHRSDPL